ncbi:MAG: alpha/beta fold hydrolase [Pseudomonadales bacterium]|jgi:predicted alpha/beta-fold hydrolase|nr:alpha/beta fold hydrolase [Pseudomonadales bacterium]
MTPAEPLHELPFAPPRALSSPHLQSLLASAPPRRPLVEARSVRLRAASRTRILQCKDGTRLEARLSLHGDRPRPLVITLHGWHGSAESLYLLSATGALFEAGFDVVRLHLRDHGGTQGLNEDLFHSCRIDEAVQGVAVLRERFPDRPLGLLGFSLGGNFALRIALRAPAAALAIDRVVAVCPVLDPGRTMTALDEGWFVYRAYFMRNWKASMDAKERHFPHRYRFDAARRLRSLSALTDWFVEHHTDYPSTAAYLSGYSLTGAALASLAVPTHLIAALDDPVIPAEALDELARPAALDIEVTRQGGHCGFIADLSLRSGLDPLLLARFAPLLESV